MIDRWIREYSKYGEKAFEVNKCPGNKYAAIHKSKHLSSEERLQLELLQLQIENER